MQLRLRGSRPGILAAPSLRWASMATTSVRPPAADVVPRQFVRDPDLWPLFLCAVVVALSALQVLLYPYGRSQASFAIAGQAVLEGGVPGRDFWIAEAPGIALLHALTQFSLGRSMTAIRSIEVLALMGFIYVATRITRRFLGMERVGVVAGAILVLTHAQLEYEHTGQPELFASLWLGLAVVITIREHRRWRRWVALPAAGMLLGTSVLFVPYYGLATLVVLVWLFRSERERRGGILGPARTVGLCVLGAMIGPLVVVLWMWNQGALPAFFHDWMVPTSLLWTNQSFEELLRGLYAAAVDATLRYSAIIAAGCLATFLLPPIGDDELRGRRLLLALIGSQLVGIGIVGDLSPGRFSGVLPWLAMLAGIGVYKVWRRALSVGNLAISGFGAGAMLLAWMCTAVSVTPGSFWSRSLERCSYLTGLSHYRALEILEGELYDNADYSLFSSRRIAMEVDRHRPASQAVLVQDDEPQVLWLARARPAARLIRPLSDAMANAAPELDSLLSRELEASLPPLVVTVPHPVSGTSFARTLELPADRLLDRYRSVAWVDGWHLLTRLARP